MSLKIYIIAGEPSGDLHGAHLVRAILEQDPSVRFRGFGGSKMEAEGVILDQDIDQLSFMGFVEVVRHSPQILANFSLAKKSIRSWQPDARSEEHTSELQSRGHLVCRLLLGRKQT